jgi:acetylornithine deacetylase
VTDRSTTISCGPDSPGPGRFLRADNLVGWLQRLVRHPSEQSELHEKDPAIARFIRECAAPLLDEIGVTYRYDAMGNLIAEIGPKSGPRSGPKSDHSLLFVAYAMTHPAAGMAEPFSATIIETPKGPAVRGRGVAEQKTALAALFGALAEAVRGAPLAGRLTVALTTAGETGRHDAIDSVMRDVECTPQFAIVCIGTSNRIAIGNKGRIDFDVLVKGKASHSSAPWLGVNAISGARRVLQALDGLDLDAPAHPHFGPATLTATAIESAPKASHTVPDLVRLTFDRRLLPGENPDAAYGAIRDAIKLEKPWEVECRLGPVMYPNEIATDGPLATTLRKAFDIAGQPVPEQFYCNFALDAGYLGRKGIEAVMLGPGEVDQFHSSEEHVLISDMVAMANVYHRMIEQCLAPND